MKKLSAIISLLLFSMCFIGQLERIDDLNRQELSRLNQKATKLKSRIVNSKVFICNANEECAMETPQYIFEYDNKGNKVKITYPENSIYSSEIWSFQNEQSFSKELKEKEDADSASNSKFLYLFNELNLCIKFNAYSQIWEPIYNESNHIISYNRSSIYDKDTVVKTYFIDLVYDSLNRLKESKEYYYLDTLREYCNSHKSYHYQGDSTITFEHFGNDLKIRQQAITRIDPNGKLLMYEKTQYKKPYSIDSKHKKLLQSEKEVYDEFSNLIEWQLFSMYKKRRKRNSHEFYKHILDDNGNILRTEVKNNKGKITKIIVTKNQ